MKVVVEYDEDADVLYVQLREGEVEDTKELDDLRMLDISEDGKVLGVEFISPSEGIDLSDIPFADTVEKAIADGGFHFKIAASP